MKKTKGEADKMGQFGPNESFQTHVNHPQDAAHIGGHELNESYKVPAANSKNLNHSYMHPLVNPAWENVRRASSLDRGTNEKATVGNNRQGASKATKMVFPVVQGKNRT